MRIALIAFLISLCLAENLHYKTCKVDRSIEKEGICQGSSAIVVASVATDAWCVSKATNTNKALLKYQFSPDHIIQCCPSCRLNLENNCFGSNLAAIFEFSKTKGLVRSEDRSDVSQAFLVAGKSTGPCFTHYSYSDCKETTGPGCRPPTPPQCPSLCPLEAMKTAEPTFTKFEFSELTGLVNIKAKVDQGISLISEMEIFTDILSITADESKKIPYFHTTGYYIGKQTVKIIGSLESLPNYQGAVWKVATTINTGDNGIIYIPLGINMCGVESKGWMVSSFIE